MNDSDLRQIVAAASTIDERLDSPFEPDPLLNDGDVARQRLERWCEAIAEGDWKRFEQRLAWDGWSIDRVRAALGGVKLAKGIPLPGWAIQLSGAVNLAIAHDPGGSASVEQARRFLDPRRPVPFEGVFVPFVLAARSSLRDRSGMAYDLLSADAHAALERFLIRDLCHFAGDTLYLEFSIFRHDRRSAFDRLRTGPDATNDGVHYQQFARGLHSGGITALFGEYSTLARVLGTILECWVEATQDFLRRLHGDWAELEATFGNGEPLERVDAIEPSLSDPHRGRRTVHAVTFKSGLKLVYKPKDIGLEEAYFRLLEWMNANGAPLQMRVLKVLHRGGYGWVEYVDREPCRAPEGVHLYYARAGMLLCIVYALGGSDCHYENLVPNGDHPVLVDLETIVQPQVRIPGADDAGSALAIVRKRIADSVLYTGLLPGFRLDPVTGEFGDRSGLGGSEDYEVNAHQWDEINTDSMRTAYGRRRVTGIAPLPVLDGAVRPIDRYADDVVDGFQRMYCYLVEQRDTMLKPGGPIHGFRRREARLIFRSSSVYGALMTKLLLPAYCRDGVDASIELERLGLSFVTDPVSHDLANKPPQFWPVFVAERHAMAQRDVPLCVSDTESDSLVVAPGHLVAGCLQPAFDMAVERLRGLDNDDLDIQLTIVEGALYARAARDPVPDPRREGRVSRSNFPSAKFISADELVAEAAAIGDLLVRRAICGPDGTATWIGLQYINRIERYSLQPLACDLYNGACGVGVFLAALADITGNKSTRQLAAATVQPLIDELRTTGDRVIGRFGIGGATGIGSCVYGLVAMSRSLGDESFLRPAQELASFIDADRIANDDTLDVVRGVAGALLGLLSLHHIGGGGLEQARACGDRLLDTRVTTERGFRTWTTVDGKALGGFSHGTAGIAYALLRLYECVPDERFREAAQEGIRYEDSLLTNENWRDLRDDSSEWYMSSWCHGASGIGLARIGGLGQLDSQEVRRDIEVALSTTVGTDEPDVDQLCCGHLGRADFLLTAGQQLGRPELALAARSQARHVIDEARQRGGYRFASSTPKHVFAPSLFQGLSGVGYELMRLAHPDRFPSVLLWQ